MDGEAGIFETRVYYALLDSAPFTFKGITVDLADIAKQMSETSLGRTPVEGLEEEIPHTEEPLPTAAPERLPSDSQSAAP
jgi:hypothetical protein